MYGIINGKDEKKEILQR